MRGDRLRLFDAIEQIDLIRSFAQKGKEAFLSDPLVQSAILHRRALLGEARGLSPTLREAHPEIPWSEIIAFRNVVIHQYFGLDLELVWAIVTDRLSPLRSSLESALNSLRD
jgi:uncharacterized protein with HEPN domain